MKIKKRIFSLILLSPIWLVIVFCCVEVYGQDFYDGHADGWHWYSSKDAEEKKSTPDDPIEQMKILRLTIERSLAKAILNPTDVNVKNYISLQNKLGDQSSKFADVWQKVLLDNPELNYSLIHPTNNLAKQVDLDLQHKKEEQAITKLAKEGGLFFFYSSTCGYCRKFAPILKNFSANYNISVIPITIDGGILPEFPNSKLNRGHAAKFSVTVEPSLFAVNPYTGKAYPVSQGLISEYDLRKRILDISQNFISGT